MKHKIIFFLIFLFFTSVFCCENKKDIPQNGKTDIVIQEKGKDKETETQEVSRDSGENDDQNDNEVNQKVEDKDADVEPHHVFNFSKKSRTKQKRISMAVFETTLSKMQNKINDLEYDIFKMDIFIIILLVCFIATLIATIFFIPSLFKKQNDVKTEIKKMNVRLSDIEKKHTNAQIATGERKGFSHPVISRSFQNEGKTYRSEVLHTEKKEIIEKLPIISSLYRNKNERTVWREKKEDVEFLNIAAKVFMQMQRNETIKAIVLEKNGTWLNSKFMLKGEYLYFNFNFYNELRPFSFEYREDEQLLRKMYAIEGNIPGNIIECSPAKVMKGAEGYQVVKQGKLLLN